MPKLKLLRIQYKSHLNYVVYDSGINLTSKSINKLLHKSIILRNSLSYMMDTSLESKRINASSIEDQTMAQALIVLYFKR